jgi:hypothetical protein
MIAGNRAKDVVAYAIDEWKKTFAGTSGLAIAAAMSMPHDEVLLILESLADEGKGTLNQCGIVRIHAELLEAIKKPGEAINTYLLSF